MVGSRRVPRNLQSVVRRGGTAERTPAWSGVSASIHFGLIITFMLP